MDLRSLVGSLPSWIRGPAVNTINAIDPLRIWISRRIINNYAYRTPPRPRAISMAADYTTWRGLTDRRFTGRHLLPAIGDTAPAQPDMEAVVKLFERDTFRESTDTSLLFAFFAQWFVDSFLRTKWEEVAEQERKFRFNESNHEIDLCQIYGIGEEQTTMLREPGEGEKRGRLKTQIVNGEEWPPPLFERSDGEMMLREIYRHQPEVDEDHPGAPGLYTAGNFNRVYRDWEDDDKRDAFAAGLEHGSSTIGNSVMNALFLRDHNRTAGILAKAHPDWDDERVFQTARNVTIAVLINIVIGDYIAHIAPVDIRLEAPPGMAEEERWYRNNWMTVEFALLYRWHDLIPDTFSIGDEQVPAPKFRRANTLILRHGLGPVLLAASQQKSGRIGLGNTAHFLIDKEGANVKRLSLRMSRACNLPSFNAYRKYYGLKPVTSFEELTGDSKTAGHLRGLYKDIDRLEWFVGLFAEDYGKADMMGELLTTMVANDAFTQALTNPLFAKAVHNVDTFGKEGFAIVKETKTLAQVIARNTEFDDADLFGFKVKSAHAA